ncbi:MAG: vWA domain-containing protein [Bacteroidota bacterium]
MSRYVVLGAILAIVVTILGLRAFQQFPFGSNTDNTSYSSWGTDLALSTTIPFEPTSAAKKIQIALLLDTSNSMDGLLEQTKSQLWKMINVMTELEKEGSTPVIEIALFQYGNDFLLPLNGYVQRLLPLSTDLDAVSEKLFGLTTNGGSEFCGYALNESLGQLSWSPDEDDLRFIFIAGNESFFQGPVPADQVANTAQKADITINTVYCGAYQEGELEGWSKAALLTGGRYLNIDQADQVRHVPTPYDDHILKLNEDLNKTYLYYGASGKSKLENQYKQDRNARSYSSANSRTRALVKSKKAYKNTNWDLIDLSQEDDAAIDKIADEALPPALQGMSSQEKKAYIDKMSQKRQQIQEEIQAYAKKVKAFIAAEQQKQAPEETLDNVLERTILELAAQKNYQ